MTTRSKRQADRKTMKLVSLSYYGSYSYSDDVKSTPKITATWSNGDYGSYYNKNEVKIDLSPEIAERVFSMIEADTGAQLREMFPEFKPVERGVKASAEAERTSGPDTVQTTNE